MRKICVVTGSRAEYGLLRPVIEGIRDAADLELQLVVTGMHLSPDFGSTWREIEGDGVEIAAKVEMLVASDTPVGITKSAGLGLIGFADALASLKPDLLVILGDRFEILSAATAALLAGVPIAHLHGGEITEGAFDDSIRHAVTKMAHLHFVAARPYRDRVIQLGESPDRVFEVGGLGVDGIRRVILMSRADLERELKFSFGERCLVVTYHPVTLEPGAAEHQLQALLDAFDECERGTTLVFTMPNADTGGRALMSLIKAYVASRPNTYAYTSLGQRRYLSLLSESDGVVGNSSSGVLEAPSFGIGTVNIGSRQDGRLKARSVIDCLPTRGEIVKGLRKLRDPGFTSTLEGTCNPYGRGGAGSAIVEIIRTVPLDGLIRKHFHDLVVGRNA